MHSIPKNPLLKRLANSQKWPCRQKRADWLELLQAEPPSLEAVCLLCQEAADLVADCQNWLLRPHQVERLGLGHPKCQVERLRLDQGLGLLVVHQWEDHKP